jgi:hypothetical protein
MKTLHDQISTFLSECSLFKDVIISKGKLRVDILNREEIVSLYELRLEIAVENSNEVGIELCSDVIEKISKMKGTDLYSILYTDENMKITGFIDEYVKDIYVF